MEAFMLVVGIGLCLVFVIMIVRAQIEGAASRRWPRVTGQVQKVVVETQSSNERDKFSARVDYHYVFQGARHRGRRYLGVSTTSRANAEDYARSYAAGQQVEVFVDDRNPRKSTLEPGFPYGSIIPLICSTGMLVFFAWKFLSLLVG
jgi:hypothetical protein